MDNKKERNNYKESKCKLKHLNKKQNKKLIK